jgi:hypothetical protein
VRVKQQAVSEMKRPNQIESHDRAFSTLFMDQGNLSCLLDENHVIVATNAAWEAFARENGIKPDYSFVGANHLEVCLSAGRQGDRHAREAIILLMAVSSGDVGDAVGQPYPCHKVVPGEPVIERWYRMRVRSLMPKAPLVMVTHEACAAPTTEVADHGIGMSFGSSKPGEPYSM